MISSPLIISLIPSLYLLAHVNAIPTFPNSVPVTILDSSSAVGNEPTVTVTVLGARETVTDTVTSTVTISYGSSVPDSYSYSYTAPSSSIPTLPVASPPAIHTEPLFSSSAPTTSSSSSYTLVHNYNASNWFTSFTYSDATDHSPGTVNYIDLAEAQSSGLTRIVDDAVYLGVDNTSVVLASDPGRKSLQLISNDSFLHGILIGDFAHVPGGSSGSGGGCGQWPAFWTIREDPSVPYGEIDILESFDDLDHGYITLHTDENLTCTFNQSSAFQSAVINQGFTTCMNPGPGCSTTSPTNSSGNAVNSAGGAVYAMVWSSSAIEIFYFPRNSIPSDITAGTPDPSTWPEPTASFNSFDGDCDIDANFGPQTIILNTNFCGSNAGGADWNASCAAKTGVSTCDQFVRENPSQFTEAYWIVNSIKVYQSS